MMKPKILFITPKLNDKRKTMISSKTGEEKARTLVDPRTLLFLDTATRYCGYAFFEKSTLLPPSFVLTGYGVIKATNDDWEVRCLKMSDMIGHVVHAAKPGTLVQEFPYYQSSVKGRAASRSGGTLELAYLCGRIAVVWEYYIVKVYNDTKLKLRPLHNVRFCEWNGQLTKEITCKRCKEHFGIKANPKSIENNYVDAIMMGKWFIEKNNGVVAKGCGDSKREDV